MARNVCLLFDCDGTLVDSEPLLADVLTETFNELGLPFVPADYMTRFRGTAFPTILATLEREHGDITPDAREAAMPAMRRRLYARMDQGVPRIAGIESALERLPHPKAVASNGPIEKIRRAMAASALAHHFGDHLYSAYEVGSHKPDPGLYLHATRALAFAPENAIVIDDAAVGVEAGLAAGMQVIHINHFPDQEATPAGAHALYHMEELPALVNHLTR
ncbi:HAD family hydrolase [Larsenimonas rhizosphaerae]|uniref:HAD family hydrolase n=1 Tax=Larsenimonas rhizosphaerae TaxID=2944682 RepID=UPI00203498EF|nr:HAD-IA family hydrolase [Larsenimonas rhizosphaerae]MCM2129733.1 HAD-IA family hydrolase [Larsenimonas rhizosphaerae]